LREDMSVSLRTHVLKDGVAYWDLFRTMGGNGSMIQWVNHNPPLAGPDYIHFTTKGAERVGDALARSMITYYDFFCIRKKIPQVYLNYSMSKASIDKFMDSVLRKKEEKDSVKMASSESEIAAIENEIVETIAEEMK
ncbi:MAG: hypothetical protein MJZ16_13095, partial [Bacteroidales bacterium]|nr:hypothetical protein [Bacteroidales bacterium]